ncbi:MAG: pyruvate, phosphate dikinase [Desulfovibrionales bacterium]|nr:MAG: pyruvate, phosphate dikinase [Desulfovibrionales bacterium]
MSSSLDQLITKSTSTERSTPEEFLFQQKYQFFKKLLHNNNRALQLINALENLLYDTRPFTFDEVLDQCEELVGVVYELAEELNAISGGKYPQLFGAAEKIGIHILRGLTRQRKLEKTCLVLPLVRLSHENAGQVGAKAANLGEISNRVGLPTPKGFAVSAYACHDFFRSAGLYKAIQGEMKGVDIQDTAQLTQACSTVQKRIIAAPLPDDLECRIFYEAKELFREFGSRTRIAVRSSATGEDSESSFAGQHSTVLNVTQDTILDTYKEVVASLFNPRAVFYRRSIGYRDQDVVMCVLCLNMIDARTSGVLYTQDPNEPESRKLIISAAWGLGVSVVDGSMPNDLWRITPGEAKPEYSGARKARRIAMNPEGGIHDVAVEEHLQDQPCLNGDEVRALANYGWTLEKHYKRPLDIEWAMDQSGKLFILQARPLNLMLPAQATQAFTEEATTTMEGHDILLCGGATASSGTACGQAIVLKSEQDLAAVPEGAILIAPQTSPSYVPLMGKIQGIITDVGSVTGHMASVAREFGLPTLVGTEIATSIIPHGEEITLDASRRTVYAGRVINLIQAKPRTNLMKGSPLFRLVKETLQKVVPLNLIDPKHVDFCPKGCLTLHDVVRFTHEKAMAEMFRINEDIQEGIHLAVKLKTSLPLNTYILDLDRGFKTFPVNGIVELEQIASRPFLALFRGMEHPGVQWKGPVGDYPSCFAMDLPEPIPDDPNQDRPSGGPNYAFISDDYLHYNARLGYHFVTIDTYCGQQVNDNYIIFSFKGGAADVSRRTRRALMIAAILKRLGLRVEQTGDFVHGEIKKYDHPRMEEKLDFIGRLMGSVHLLDMVLTDDAQIPWYVEQFFKGNYSFKP